MEGFRFENRIESFDTGQLSFYWICFFDHNKTLLFLVYQNSTRVFSCVSFYGCSTFNCWPIWWAKRKTNPTACSLRKPSTPNLRWTNQKFLTHLTTPSPTALQELSRCNSYSITWCQLPQTSLLKDISPGRTRYRRSWDLRDQIYSFYKKSLKRNLYFICKELRQNLSSFNVNQFQDHQYRVCSRYHLVP